MESMSLESKIDVCNTDTGYKHGLSGFKKPPGLREHVCDVLEGEQDAFKKER
jgi:hypothetical protein